MGPEKFVACTRTDFIQLHQKVFGMLLVEQRFAGAAVWAVALGEDDDRVLVDDLLGLFAGGNHGFR
jgi:hypothetical protein